MISTFILVGIFVLVAFAAQAVKGADYLTNHSDDVLSATGHLVFGSSGFGDIAVKLLIIAVLSSSAASCQTTILPAARTSLSMAMHRAFPPKLGEVDTQAPHTGVRDVVVRHRLVALVRRCSWS